MLDWLDRVFRTTLDHLCASVTGHDQRLATFASFLRKNLAANHVSPLVQVALERTIIFWPSTAGVVPIVDTPGTSDANSLNADTTHQAVSDAMARTSSQLLLCGEKTFETEGSLAEYVIPYFKHMITSKSGLPAIKGILMPNNQFHYGPAELASAHLQTEDKERVATSMAQLCKWLDMANKDLPTEQRASEAQLQTLQKRCEVRVVYTQLYASLCLQSSADLDGLAISANLSSNQLLSLTNGPWLLSKLHLTHQFEPLSAMPSGTCLPHLTGLHKQGGTVCVTCYGP